MSTKFDWRRAVLHIVTPLVAVLVAACSASPATPSPSPISHAIVGTFSLARGNGSSSNWMFVSGDSGPCKGKVGYEDFGPNIPVVLKDQAGTIIATTSTVFDRVTEGSACRLTFVLTGIPDAPFYVIEMGRRGPVTYSRDELVARGWTLDLTLGS